VLLPSQPRSELPSSLDASRSIGANESAFGVSPRAAAAMSEAARGVAWYCDPEGYELRAELAAMHGVDIENVTLGAGIDDLLGLIVLVLLVHSLQAHKEYRFIFAVIPLWLLIGAGLLSGLAERRDEPRWFAGLATAGFAAVSLAGILNALPYQDRVYEAWSRETGRVSFIRNQDPIFPAYRYLACAPGVSGVWQVDRPYFNLPGYYYLHHKIPFYDKHTGRGLKGNVEAASSLVSHIVSGDSGLSVPGYSLERRFGEVRILRRDQNELPVRPWIGHAPVIVSNRSQRIMRQMDLDAPTQPANFGIQFAGREGP